MSDSLIQILLALYEKAVRTMEDYMNKKIERVLTPDQIITAAPFLMLYTHVRAAYIIHFYKQPPKHNDLADLEIMTYLGPNSKVLTYEKKWLNLAEEWGLSDHILKPDIKLPTN